MNTPVKKSVSETGHAKNAANFQSLISFCSGFGTAYNPSKASLSTEQLQLLLQNAQNVLEAVRVAKTSFDNATNNRKSAFSSLKTLATKIVNAYSVSGSDQLGINNMKSTNKKLQGTSKKEQPAEGDEAVKKISTSQQSYDKIIEHFAAMIEILVQSPDYNPNEIDLKVTSLQAKLSDLQLRNTELVAAYTEYSNAMLNRNQVLYNALSGLVQTAKEVKQYVKSVFGTTSPQYKQVSGIEFKSYKIG
ncbi:hypothetical protein [Chryseobacterium taihuense]|uniref:Uncharacterized protein n=1 Tax=Chryseobacterium taihuense TaxID=1141221 RepID=A0ABY0R2B8_9FLAO|nr:hypothetical protein [Chryseobacterium taihuense]SDM28100.1 hypothetical protein SAMN05216273_1201 [Chryseobacterium taihuense]